MIVVSLSACTSSDTVSMYELPIGWEGGWGWLQWIIGYLGDFLFWISNLFGGYYWVGLVVLTLIVRTVGWPIYAKSNQTTANMQMAQPELTKLQEKYKGRSDEASQRKMQAEQLEIYKKYGINPLGCLLPFLQMPIFIAMYQVVRRVPLSAGQFDGLKDYSSLKYGFLWIEDLGLGDPIYILPILVVLLMYAYQKFSMKKPDYLQNKKFEKTDQQSQTENTMKIMMYMMPLMLGYIALTNSGIALYWIVGNAYQFLQTYISRKQMKKKYEEIKGL
jgi:YidC/Oxa1 family membrane protein insertase